jgi:hypothetical protein
MSSSWEAIERAVDSDGGRRIESQGADAQAALELLKSLRIAIVRYEKLHGQSPDFTGPVWKELQATQLIKATPRNPFSPREVADQVEIITTPGMKGDVIDDKKSGWVWNSSNNALYLAGHDDVSLAKLSQGALSGEHALALPDAILMARLNLLRNAVARLQTTGHRPGKVIYPTIAELVAHVNEHGKCPANPMNDQSTIQALEWVQRSPAVRGNAGWNYDSKAGHIWANSAVLDENRF